MSTSFQQSRSSSKAFTLIEVLTVIAIIVILATIVLANLNAARVKARDAIRLKDLETIQAAVEQSYRDQGHYPDAADSSGPPAHGWGLDKTDLYYGSSLNIFQKLDIYFGAGVYAPGINVMPVDPSGIANGTHKGYQYVSDSGGLNYKIFSLIRPENMNDFPTKYWDMTRCISVVNGQCTGQNSVGFWTSGGAGL